MVDSEAVLRTFYELHGLEITQRCLNEFYATYLRLHEHALPEVAMDSIRVGLRYRDGNATVEQLDQARSTCISWINAHKRDYGESPEYFAARAANFLAFPGDDTRNEDDLYTEMNMFHYFVVRAFGESADFERCLRTTFEAPRKPT